MHRIREAYINVNVHIAISCPSGREILQVEYYHEGAASTSKASEGAYEWKIYCRTRILSSGKPPSTLRSHSNIGGWDVR